MIELNKKIKHLYISWLKDKKCFVPISTSNPREVRWAIWEYNLTSNRYNSKKQSDCLGVSLNQNFISDFNKLNFLGNAKDWFQIGCVFETETEKYHMKELFFHIYDNLNPLEKKEFLAMCTRLFKAGNIMDFTNNRREVFNDWVNITPSGYAGMMSHEDMAKFLKVFHSIFDNNKERENILYKYLSTRKRMGKRIETQQILKSYINNFIEDKKRFEIFLDKISNLEFFKSTGNLVSFNVDKIGFYNEVNPSGKPIAKYSMTELLLALMSYINNSEEEKKRLFLNQFIVLNKEATFDYYSIIFDSSENNPRINYRDFFKKVLPSCIELIGENFSQPNGFKSAISKYFLDIAIPEKETIELPIKIVKI